MLGAIVFVVYILLGIYITARFIKKLDIIKLFWLGSCLGLELFMFLPVLFALVFRLSVLSNIVSILSLAVFCALIYKKDIFRNIDCKVSLSLKVISAISVLSVFICYLFITHILLPEDGSLYVGQSTYGDLPMHLSMAKSLMNSRIPAEYNIYPPFRLSYPFLINALSASLMLLGMSLQASFILPSAMLALLAFTGFYELARYVLKSEKKAILALFLLFVNGGLGFIYLIDMKGISLGSLDNNQLQMGSGLISRLSNVLNGWYQTPANHAEFSRYNLRWSNIIVDMLVPQRTFLAGITLFFPIIFLLLNATNENNKSKLYFASAFIGLLPLIHTHTFLAVFLACAGLFLLDLIKRRPIKAWLIFGLICAAISLPQLYFFTFKQALSSKSFLRFGFNWVNFAYGQKDFYIWFYIKNIGLPFVFLLLSLFDFNKAHGKIYLMALFIWLPAELILFQPNEYDNNKLLYLSFSLWLLPSVDFMGKLYSSLKGLKARRALAVLAIFSMFFTGVLALSREAVSKFQMFNSEDIRLADWIEKNTKKDELFITGRHHVNPVTSLAGRRIFLGPDIWLVMHGVDTRERKEALNKMYEEPENALQICKAYFEKEYKMTVSPSYMVLGPYEYNNFNIDDKKFGKLELIYENDNYKVYKLK